MKITLIIGAILIVLGFVFWKDISELSTSSAKSSKTGKNESKKKDRKEQNMPSEITVRNKWEMPADLKEISGIAYIDNDRFACVQDEEGIVFIFNRAMNKVEKQIPFAGPGDYEGITVNGNTAYIVRADGKLYEVDMTLGKSSVKEYATNLTVEHNIEGLCYDKKNARLLLAAKDDEPARTDYKAIYAFDLSKKKLTKEPAFKIDLKHELLAASGDKKHKPIMPSAIGIHPVTDEIYITDGPKARLLIMDRAGNIKKLYQLVKDFAQPEGITFSPQGHIFISNEGSKQAGNILEVQFQN